MISRKKLLFSSLLLLSLMLVLGVFKIQNTSEIHVDSTKVVQHEFRVVIDAGHGGVDGGAIAFDGTLEKDINLDIALILNEMLKSSGIKTVLIRDSDVSIHDKSAKTIRAKKASDLHNRLEILNSNSDGIFVSIHQNIFEDSRYSGAQIFYSPNNENSVLLARKIQDSFSMYLQKDNSREIKKCSTDVFLIYNSKSTAVLCECGFLSNKKELENLKTNEYKKQVAFCIYLGILEYYSSL